MELGLNADNLNVFCAGLSQKYKVALILITRGQNGVFAYHQKKGAFYDPGYKIEITDNIGSGMAFSAGFLHYYLNGKTIQQALNFGNAAGALNTTKRGATSYFNKKEVLNFMKNTPKNQLQ
jgi:fructokinase